MKASTKRVLSLLGTAVLFVAALAIYALLLSPEYTGLTKARGELAASQKLYDDQSSVIAKVKDLVAQYQGTAKIQDTISLTLPNNQAVSSLVAQIQAIAASSGSTVESMSLQTLAVKPPPPGSPEGTRGIGIVRINLRLTASYASAKSFMSGVETNIRLMDVTSWRAEPITKDKPEPLSYTIVIDAYYQAD